MVAALVFVLVGGIGALAQIVDGALGMGFGVFSASLMVGAGIAPPIAVAVVNTAKIFTGLSSGISHWRFGNVRREWLLPLIVSGIVGGGLGAYLLTSLPPDTVRPWVSLTLLGMGILIVWRSLRWRVPFNSSAPEEQQGDCANQKARWERVTRNNSVGKLGALGFLAAFVNGVSGAYGPMATSGVMLMEKGHPRHAVGTVNLAEFFVATTVAVTIIGRRGFSEFPVGLVLALALGGTLAAPLAAYVCHRVSPRALGFLIGGLLILLNIQIVA
ncbi:MAG: sulfite exporter TauE/SafE family protein [Chloroflexi bacterium]|nr:sulfite exporter TauE/SafE family protein [Chloroflexota bacterium]